jgi:hypothetical protein
VLEDEAHKQWNLVALMLIYRISMHHCNFVTFKAFQAFCLFRLSSFQLKSLDSRTCVHCAHHVELLFLVCAHVILSLICNVHHCAIANMCSLVHLERSFKSLLTLLCHLTLNLKVMPPLLILKNLK